MSNRGFNTVVNYELFSLTKILSLRTGKYRPKPKLNASLLSDYGQEGSLDDSFSAITSQSSTTSFGDVRGVEEMESQSDSASSGSQSSFKSSPQKSPNRGMSPSRRKFQDDCEDLSVFSTSKRVTFRQVIACSKKTFHLLVCLCSNNFLLFRFVKLQHDAKSEKTKKENVLFGKARREDYSRNRADSERSLHLSNPLIKTLGYFHEKNIQIVNISMHEKSGKWLAVFDRAGTVYVIPVFRVLFPVLCSKMDSWPFDIPSDEELVVKFPLLSNMLSSQSKYRSKVNFLRDEVHRQTINVIHKESALYNAKEHGFVTCSVWWKTFEDMFYVIFGTSVGNIVILNMNTLEEECVINTGTGTGIKDLVMMYDKDCFFKCLLVISLNGKFHKLMLEQENEYNCYKTIVQHYKREKTSEELMESEKRDEFMRDEALFRMQSFVALDKEYPCEVFMTKDKKKGRLLGKYSRSSNQVAIFGDLSIIANDSKKWFPLFVYQVNKETELVKVTEKLLFTVQKEARLKEEKLGERMWIISKLLSNEVHIRPESKHEENAFVRKNYTVFQEFIFEPNQRIRGFLPGIKVFPTSLSLSLSQNGDSDEVLEGCFIYSQDAVYELRNKNSPREVFNQLLSKFSQQEVFDHFITDRFGKTFNLNLFQFYESIADREYKKGNYDIAFKLYNLSNIDAKKLVERLRACGMHADVLAFLNGKVIQPERLSMSQRDMFCNMLFDSYLDKIKTIEFGIVRKYARCNEKYAVDKDEINDFLHWKLTDFEKREGEELEGEETAARDILSKLKEFLLTKPFYEKKRVIARLIDINFIPLVIEIAHYLNNLEQIELETNVSVGEVTNKDIVNYMKLTLELLRKRGVYILSHRVLEFLLHFGYATLLYDVGGRHFLFNHFSTERTAFRLRFLIAWLKQKKIEHDFRRKDAFVTSKRSKSSSQPTKKVPLEPPVTTTLTENDTEIQEVLLANILEIKVADEDSRRENESVLLELLQLFDLDSTILLEIKELKIDQKGINSASIYEYAYFPGGFSIMNHIEMFFVTLLNYLTFTKKHEIYHNKLFKESLVNYSNFYRKAFVLKMCLYYGNIKAVELIYTLNKCWINALDCRLCFIRQQQSREVIEQKLLKAFQSYVLEYNLSSDIKEVLILKVFRFWNEMKLKVKNIEELSLKNINLIGHNLSHLLLSERKFYLKFSSTFYLAIAEYYTNGLKKFDEDEDRIMANLESQILKNMKQDVLPKHNFISLSLNDVNRTLSAKRNEWMCFTCGHMFEKADFFKNNMEFFKKKMEGLNRNEVNSLKNRVAFGVIKKEYCSKLFNQACPRCVFSYFRKIN